MRRLWKKKPRRCMNIGKARLYVHHTQLQTSSQKGQFTECRVSTVKDLVNSSSTIPNDFSIYMLDEQDAMLRDELFVCRVFLPIAHVHFQLTLKSIHEDNCIVYGKEVRVPCDAIDDV